MIRVPASAAAAPILVLLTAAAAFAAPAATPAGPPRLVRSTAGWSVAWSGRSETLSLPAAAEIGRVSALGDGWIAAGVRMVGERAEIFLLADRGAGPVEIAPPGDAVGLDREGATPVVAGGALAGVAWLEGDERRSYAVRWAPWTGSAFGAPVEVAPRGPGSQLALAGTALADGRILLVWAGFDGLDDEIWASLGTAGTDGAWSRPQRVGADNTVPDITPDVVAEGAGALVAWSRYENGEYRVRLARLAGSRFEELDAEGPGGSLYPTFAGAAEGPLVLYRDARADDWALAELTPGGSLATRARAAGPVDQRPSVAVAGGKAWFRFPDGSTVADWR
jgi:hypothetical protein